MINMNKELTIIEEAVRAIVAVLQGGPSKAKAVYEKLNQLY